MRMWCCRQPRLSAGADGAPREGTGEGRLRAAIARFRLEEFGRRGIGLADEAEPVPGCRVLSRVTGPGCRAATAVGEAA